MKPLATFVIPSIAVALLAANPTAEPTFEHPVIKQHGGIVPLPDAAQQPQPNSKVLLDIISDEKSGGVIKGFDRAALILNQYSEAGAGPDHGFKLAVILHGPATKAALHDEAYARHMKPYARAQGTAKNPDLPLIRELRQHGVEVFVCGQALAHQGYALDEVAPEVTVAVSAATVNINLQTDGYAYIPFH